MFFERTPFGLGTEEKCRVNDIMAVRETAAAPGRRHRGPRARVRAGAERLRPPLHLLHHPVRARELALGADGRGRRAGAPARRERLSRGGADRRRHHELRRGPARRAAARQAGAADPEARAGARAAAHLVDRLGRGRRRPARRDRRRAAADAASASLAAARRRPDPQAHEAAAFARRRDRVHATRCAGCAPTSCSAPTSSRASRPRPTTLFARSRDLVAECGLTHLHVFPYSARPGTPAARMPQVPHHLRKERARLLRQDGEAALRRHLERRSRRTTPRAHRVRTTSAAPSSSRRCASPRRPSRARCST